MKTFAMAASLLALTLTIVPAFLVLVGTISRDTHVGLMTGGMILWFLSAPAWMKKK